ncbi:MAG: damage repair protein, partial [Bacilli bacterium]|nr:damage repair protein [Bacilli bacterium]
MKAFYAFVECVDRGLDPFKTPLAVVDTERGEGTIVLSVSPYLKSLGYPSRCRK